MLETIDVEVYIKYFETFRVVHNYVSDPKDPLYYKVEVIDENHIRPCYKNNDYTSKHQGLIQKEHFKRMAIKIIKSNSENISKFTTYYKLHKLI